MELERLCALVDEASVDWSPVDHADLYKTLQADEWGLELHGGKFGHQSTFNQGCKNMGLVWDNSLGLESKWWYGEERIMTHRTGIGLRTNPSRWVWLAGCRCWKCDQVCSSKNTGPPFSSFHVLLEWGWCGQLHGFGMWWDWRWRNRCGCGSRSRLSRWMVRPMKASKFDRQPICEHVCINLRQHTAFKAPSLYTDPA